MKFNNLYFQYYLPVCNKIDQTVLNSVEARSKILSKYIINFTLSENENIYSIFKKNLF